MKLTAACICCLCITLIATTGQAKGDKIQFPDHPLQPNDLVNMVFQEFDEDSNLAINLEEMEAAFHVLHKNRPGPRTQTGSDEVRHERHGPPPPSILFSKSDKNQDKQLQRHELLQLFEELERAHRAIRAGAHDPKGPPPPGSAPY
jgi:hypothetical protein